MSDKTYSDQEVVAAINSCIDIKKLNQIESHVIDRFRDLIKWRRIGAVCFFTASGFGVKVYQDVEDFEVYGDGDMATLKQKSGTHGRLNLDGYWVECPALLYEKRKAVRDYIIANPTGKLFWMTAQPGDWDDEQEFKPMWTSSRRRAASYTDKAEALAIADQIEGGGVVLERE